MITVILLAIMGNKVYPDQLNWWIAYVVFMSILKIFSFVYWFGEKLYKKLMQD